MKKLKGQILALCPGKCMYVHLLNKPTVHVREVPEFNADKSWRFEYIAQVVCPCGWSGKEFQDVNKDVAIQYAINFWNRHDVV